jgi:hypothetical protein
LIIDGYMLFPYTLMFGFTYVKEEKRFEIFLGIVALVFRMAEEDDDE